MGEKMALYGGSFNPIHIGHLITARAIAEHLGLSRVFFVPSARPPHKWSHELASPAHRLEMVRLAIQGEPGFGVTDVELRQPRLTYPIQSIELFRQELGVSAELHWVVGGDTLRELPSWYRLGDMLELCRLVIAARPGFQLPDMSALSGILREEQIEELRSCVVPSPQIEVSATVIRQRVRERRSIRHFVPDAVCDYIDEQGLYLPPTED
jgi:nicotinate-nucleotide adenylyltransferase